MDWNRIVDEHGRMVFGVAWRILGHVADAEDVVQETFLEAYRMRSRHPILNWGGLLRRLTTFRALDRLRQRRPLSSLEDTSVECHSSSPEEIAIGHELVEQLRIAIVNLPDREATVFCMRYFEEMSNREIAASLQISTGAVGVALHKARVKLEPEFVTSVAEVDCATK